MEQNTRILIADENAGERQIIAEGLRRLGFRNIMEATNGEDAMAKITQLRPDVVLLDVWLSKLDGIGVLRQCRTLDPTGEHSPIFIIISMISNQNIFVEATNAGAALCLPKPVDTASLGEHITGLL